MENRKQQLLEQLRELAGRLKGVPKTYQEIKEREQLQAEYNKLLEQYMHEPLILEAIEPTIEVHVKIDWIHNGVTFKLGDTSKYMDDGRPCKIEYNEEGYPTAITYTVQDREIPNIPCLVKIPIKTDKLKELVTVKKEKEIIEVIKEVPSTKTVKVQPEFLIACKRCNTNLVDVLRPLLRNKICPRCNTPLWDALRYGTNELTSTNEWNKRANNKKVFKW